MKPVTATIDTHLVLNIDELGPEATTALRQRFTRPNPKWRALSRMGRSTHGIPRLLLSYGMDLPFLTLPRGTVKVVSKILAEYGFECLTIHDRTRRLESQGFRLQRGRSLRNNQKQAVADMVTAGSGVLKGGCGSGKTVMLLAAIAELDQPTVVVVHSKLLMRQWKGMVVEWLGVQPGNIGGGTPTFIKPLTVAMQQTIWHLADLPRTHPDRVKITQSFGCLAGDEIHRWNSETFQATTAMMPAAHRIGCSATVKRKDEMEYLVEETFGPVVHEIKNEDLISDGDLLPIRLEMVPTRYQNMQYLMDVECGVSPDWNSMVSDLVGDDDRNMVVWKHIMRVLADDWTKILILNERVRACRDWVEFLLSKGVSAGLMVGGARDRPELEQTIRGLKTGEVRVGCGTKVADEGLDIPGLTHVFVTCPVHQHPMRLTQMLGRTARPSDGKTEGVGVYFWDRRLWPHRRDSDTDVMRGRREKEFLRKLGRVCDELEVVQS